MFGKLFLISAVLSLSATLAAGADAPAPRISVSQVLERNAEARGGLEKWRAVQSMSMSGTMEAGGKQNTQLPFVLELKRPHDSRLELQFNGQTAVQVFDGTNGWKLRPFLNRHQVEPYTSDELKAALMESQLDGPLIDAAAKGTKVELEGTEDLEYHKAYKLKLTLKNGQVRHVWVDTETFLDLKVDGTPRRLDGRYHPVVTYLRDYRSVNGLMVPYILETAVEGVKRTEKIKVNKVSINPALADSEFAKPE